MCTYGTFCEGSPSDEAWMWIADILSSFFFVTVYFRVKAGNSRENLASCQHRTKMPSEETKVSFIEFIGTDMTLNYLSGTHQ